MYFSRPKVGYFLNSPRIPLLLDFFISHTIGPTDLFHPSPAPHFKTFQTTTLTKNELQKIFKRIKLNDMKWDELVQNKVQCWCDFQSLLRTVNKWKDMLQTVN